MTGLSDRGYAGLLAVDFDGTLLRSDGSVSDRTLAVLSELRDRGWLVVGATGRPPEMARSVYRSVSAFTHVVCNNGTLTWDLRSGSEVIIDQQSLSQHDALWTVSVVREADAGARFVIDQIDESQAWESGFEELVSNPPLGEMVPDAPATIRTDVRKVITWSPTIHHDTFLDVLHPLLAPRAEPTHAGLAFVEIGPPGVSKASALQRLAGALHDGAQSIAFGDAPNDNEMLAWATVGVAMGDADPRTLAVADTSTATNDADGVAAFLETHLQLNC